MHPNDCILHQRQEVWQQKLVIRIAVQHSLIVDTAARQRPIKQVNVQMRRQLVSALMHFSVRMYQSW